MSVNMDPSKRDDFDINVSQTEKIESSTAEDVARSIGYLVGAPIVCATSIVGAALFLFACPCCCTGMALHADNPESGVKFMNVAVESLTGKPSIRCLVQMNQGFYDWAQPFQQRVSVIHPSHAHNN